MRAGEHVCVLTWGRGSVLRAAGGAPRGRRVRQKGRRGDHQASSETAHRRYGGALRPATFLISFLRSLRAVRAGFRVSYCVSFLRALCAQG